MIELLESWVNIQSGSHDLQGLQKMLEALSDAFAPLGGSLKHIELPPKKLYLDQERAIEQPVGKALSITKHPHASVQVFLGGHMDTANPGWEAEKEGKDLLRGPGACDMKGGLLILLKALERLESSPFAGKIGWEVLINPDEEIGSPSSSPLFKGIAERNHLGLIFEPPLAGGKIAGKRKGSANLTAFATGKKAHAGRHFFEGKNAISALARFIPKLESLTDPQKKITVNVGIIEGGEGTNVVPDKAFCRFNVRVEENLEQMINHMQTLAEKEGIVLFVDSVRPAKPLDKKTAKLLQALTECGEELAHPIDWEETGGVCDGNNFAALGLPVIDTMGAVGGKIHTEEEFVFLPSLKEKIDLASSFLIRIAKKETAPC